MLKATPNIQICTNHVLSGVEAIQLPNGGYRAWPTELRFTLSSCSAGLREILCSWPGVAIGSWP